MIESQRNATIPAAHRRGTSCVYFVSDKWRQKSKQAEARATPKAKVTESIHSWNKEIKMPGGRAGRETKKDRDTPRLRQQTFFRSNSCTHATFLQTRTPHAQNTHRLAYWLQATCCNEEKPSTQNCGYECMCVCVCERERESAREKERLRDKQSTEGECFQNFSLLLQNLVLFLSLLRALTHFFTAAYHGSVTQCFSLQWKKTPRRTQGSEFGSMGIGASAWEGVVHLILQILKIRSPCHNRMRMCIEIGVF